MAVASGRAANIFEVSTMRWSHSKVVTVSPFHGRLWFMSISRMRSARIRWVSRRKRQISGDATSAMREVFMRPGTSWM